MEEGYFQLVVHHSGTFCDARYVGGDTSTWSYDGDRWSYFEILGILKEMGDGGFNSTGDVVFMWRL